MMIATQRQIATLAILLSLNVGLAQAQSRFYVRPSAPGAQTGLDWANAFSDLQNALQAASAGDTIWVSEGSYKATTTTDRSASFVLPRGVVLFGGFAGTETAVQQRDWTAHPTVLSGDIGVPGDTTDNSYHILRLLEADSNTTIDGLVFRYGNSGNETGSALQINNDLSGEPAKVTIANCLFQYNQSGAVFITANTPQTGFIGNTLPTFINCHFRESTGQTLISQRSVVLRSCRFIKNYGRACYVGWQQGSNLSAAFYQCIFAENQFSASGAAIEVYYGTGKVVHCLFYENWGASIYPNRSTINIYNSIFWNSRVHQDVDREYSTSEQGNLYHCLLKKYDTDYPVGILENCIYGTENTAYSGPQGCCQGCQTGTGGATVPAEGFDPLFVDAANEDYRLDDCSVAIDAGSNTYLNELEKDLAGHDRVQHSTVDLGPFEFSKPVRDCRIYVTDTCNACPGSFRRALAKAKSNPGPDTVRFAMTGPAPYIFHPLNSTQGCLVAEGDGTVVDATTQPGYLPGIIQLDGGHLYWPSGGVILCRNYEGFGLRMIGNDMAVYGLYFSNWREFSKGAVHVVGNNFQLGGPNKGNYFIDGLVIWAGDHGKIQSNVFGKGPDGVEDVSRIRFRNCKETQIGGELGSGKENYFYGSTIHFWGENLLGSVSYISGNILKQSQIWFYKDQFGNFTTANGFTIGGSPQNANYFDGSPNGVHSDFLISDSGILRGIIVTHNQFRCVGDPFSPPNDSAFQLPLTLQLATTTQITGQAPPGDSVQVYRVDDTDCPGTRCQGGTVLGNVVTDSLGHWTLENPLHYIYPGQRVTALSFRSDSNAYTSIFANCQLVECGTAFTNLTASICVGDTYWFQGMALTGTGTYDTLLLSANGCDSLVTLVLINYPVFQVMATIVPDDGTGNGIIIPGLVGGAAPFSFLWSDGDTTAQRRWLPHGTYSVTITDFNGCSQLASFVVDYVVADQEPGYLTAIQLSPNPFTNSFEIKASEDLGLLTATIYNAVGQLIESKWFMGSLVIVGRSYLAGVYQVVVSRGSQMLLSRQIVKE